MCMEGGTESEGIELEWRKGDFARSCGELERGTILQTGAAAALVFLDSS